MFSLTNLKLYLGLLVEFFRRYGGSLFTAIGSALAVVLVNNRSELRDTLKDVQGWDTVERRARQRGIDSLRDKYGGE